MHHAPSSHSLVVCALYVCAGVSICNGAETCGVGGPAKGGGGEEERGPVGQCRPGETDADGRSSPGKA